MLPMLQMRLQSCLEASLQGAVSQECRVAVSAFLANSDAPLRLLMIHMYAVLRSRTPVSALYLSGCFLRSMKECDVICELDVRVVTLMVTDLHGG
mmetsp:Transcript_98575/g.195558  ORF Transcript_98575/g.195558 Transcript_98575/m.195558 type:complete len:95 (-) Transcript_98575:31-315(-)